MKPSFPFSRHAGLRVPAAAGLMLVAVLSQATVAAQPPWRGDREDPRLASARRDVEMARLRLERYRRLDYPVEIRRVESAIKIATAEVEMFRRQVAEYEQFTKFKYSAPLFTSLEHARLNLLKAETALADLEHERRLVEQDRRRRQRLLELELEAAQERLAQLDPAAVDQPAEVGPRTTPTPGLRGFSTPSRVARGR